MTEIETIAADLTAVMSRIAGGLEAAERELAQRADPASAAALAVVSLVKAESGVALMLLNRLSDAEPLAA